MRSNSIFNFNNKNKCDLVKDQILDRTFGKVKEQRSWLKMNSWEIIYQWDRIYNNHIELLLIYISKNNFKTFRSYFNV